jgi:predicted GIY-YIG superfamily endonuclease
MTVTYYKLKHASDETKQFYIGSTDNIERRIKGHKTNYNTMAQQLKLYNYIKSNGGFDAWTFEILEQEEIGGYEFRRYKKEASLIKQHDAKLNTTMPAPSYDIDDYRRQICGSCGEELDITKTCKAALQRHFKLKRCINATPPIILKGKNNTINITITKGKRPIIIEGDDNTLNIHYNID